MKGLPLLNPIRLVAVICVAITTGYVMFMGYWLIEILSSPEWCGKALQAEKISSQNFGGLTACIDLLKIQLRSLAVNSYMLFGVIALCLLTLIVIVIAGAHLAGKVSKDGGEIDLGPGPTPVVVTNTPVQPVPTTEAPKP